ncbi:MAG: hypothetical protein HC827_15245 [Cyanobacteria bacterium RM1_2_2]|nr:hypothetical protein [Cyanobacteria bacterium RM1_2_2]
MLKTHLQPILNFFFADSIERKEGRSSQSSMLKNYPIVQPSHLQPVVNYFNEQAQEKATASKLSQRSQPTQPSDSKQANWLHWLWKTLLIIDPDPQVKQRVDHTGQQYWQVYDPITERYSNFFSEDEVYQWLEARYYL